MPRWVLVLLVLAIGFCLLSMAAFILLPLLVQGPSPKIGTVLVYEMDGLKPTQDVSKFASESVKVLNRRFYSKRHPLAVARIIEGSRIEVGVYGNDPQTVAEVESLVEKNTTLEFRIVANRHKHRAEIELAESEPEKEVYFDSKGEWTARWVPLKEGEKLNPEENVLRSRKIDDKLKEESLVVRDPYDVTGEYLKTARLDFDPNTNRPCICFTLDSIGGQLFGELTSDNRPTPTEPDLYNQLAIILDGVIYSAPNIHVTITNRGIITGNFTPPELVRFANRLNSGTLPAKLRKVEEQNVEKK